MNTKLAVTVLIVAVIFGGSIWSSAQEPTQIPPDSVVQIAAEAHGLAVVPADQLPRFGTFWVVLNGVASPVPVPFLYQDSTNAPVVYSLGVEGQFLEDNTGGVPPQPSWRQAQRGVTSATLLLQQGNAVLDLIAQVQSTPPEAVTPAGATVAKPASLSSVPLASAAIMSSSLVPGGTSGLLGIGCACSCSCATGGQIYFTNLSATLTTNAGMVVSFNVAGGTNAIVYGVYITTNLGSPQWAWVQNAYTCSTVYLTNQPANAAFYALGAALPTVIFGWGDDSHGQCDAPLTLGNTVSIAGGYYHTLALRNDGTLWAWGDNSEGQTNVPSLSTNVLAIAAGAYHNLALKADHTVTNWGAWWDGSFYAMSLPVNLTNVVAIAAGATHDLAVRCDGSVTAWGYYTNYACLAVPTNLPPAMAVAAGWFHSVALLTNGTVAAWGINGSGLFPSPTNVPAGLSNVVAIAAGAYHTLVLKADGTVVAWGAGSTTNGGFANSGQAIVPAGLSNVVAIAAGGYQSLALQSNGTVVVWGNFSLPSYSLDHIVGLGSGVQHALALRDGTQPPFITFQPTNQAASVYQNPSFNVSVLGLAPMAYQWQFNGVNIQGGTNAGLVVTNVRSEDAGGYQAVVTNAYGSVTSSVVTLSVTRPLVAPGFISGWGDITNHELSWPQNATNVIALAAGEDQGVALLENGAVVDWGSYWTGTNFMAAFAPPPLTNVIAVAAGRRHDLALLQGGQVVAWGMNDSGQTNVPASATNVIAIAAGGQQSLALKQDGTVVQWGQTNAPIPAGLTNATAIASGTNFYLALLSNTTVQAWGANNFGQTNVPVGLTNVVAIAAGGAHALALKVDGTVTAWGSNNSGETNVPGSLSNVMAVAAGDAFSVALKNDGTVVAWGDNSYGQLNVLSNLPPVKLIAAGGTFTLASQFSTLTQYQVDVTKDLLLIYNTNSTDSIWVKNYYLANRPMVANANVLAIGCSTNPTILPQDYTNTIATTVQNWLSANPTKRPQYVTLMAGIPWRVNTNAAATALGSYDQNSSAYLPSVQYRLSAGCSPGWQPFVTSINMGAFGQTNGVNANFAVYTNACKAYIDKLASFATNSPSKLNISANSGGYGNTNLLFDGVHYGDNWPWPGYGDGPSLSNIVATVQAMNLPGIGIVYTDGAELSNAIVQPPHITNAIAVASYVSWGEHSLLGGQYATDGEIKWQGNSSWYLIETIESYNGQPGAGMGDFFQWFSIDAFGGTNYSSTPVGAVTHVDEPNSGINNIAEYFGLWSSGKNFAICAWNSRKTQYFQAVGDPFTTR